VGALAGSVIKPGKVLLRRRAAAPVHMRFGGASASRRTSTPACA